MNDFGLFLTDLDCSGDRATELTHDLIFYFAELKSHQVPIENTVHQGLYITAADSYFKTLRHSKEI